MLKFVKILALAFLVSVSNFAYAKPISKPAEDLPYTVLPRTDRLCFRASFHSGRRYADLIFTGRFIEEQNLGASILIFGRERQNAQFEIVESFKGDLTSGERFYVQVEDIYDYEFAPNEVYLVFAYNHYKDKYTSLACPRIEPAFKYNDRMPYLRVPDDIERNKLLKKKLFAESKGEIFISKLDGPVYVKGGIVQNQTPAQNLQSNGQTRPVEEFNINPPATELPDANPPVTQQPTVENTQKQPVENQQQQKLPDFITDDFVPLENLEGGADSNQINNTPNAPIDNNIPAGNNSIQKPIEQKNGEANEKTLPNNIPNNQKPNLENSNKEVQKKNNNSNQQTENKTKSENKNAPPIPTNNQIPELDILDLKPLDSLPSSGDKGGSSKPEDNFDILPPDLN